MRYDFPRAQNHIRYRSRSFLTHGLQIAYSSGPLKSMAIVLFRVQCMPLLDSAYLIKCRMSSFLAPHAVFDPYHIRNLPLSIATHGYEIVYGSVSLSSTTGNREQRVNGAPLSSEIASPNEFCQGTVTVRRQPM